MRRKVDIAKEYGQQIARRMFQDFLDRPGLNLSWMNFRIGEYVEHQVGLNLWWKGRSEKLLKQCQNVATEAARETWLNLVKEHKTA